MKVIENQTFDMERALYGSEELLVQNCSFDGPADGESAFKEGRNTRGPPCKAPSFPNPEWKAHGHARRDSAG